LIATDCLLWATGHATPYFRWQEDRQIQKCSFMHMVAAADFLLADSTEVAPWQMVIHALSAMSSEWRELQQMLPKAGTAP